MKVRCVNNSIRFRLRKSDVAELNKKKELSIGIRFPNGSEFKFGIALVESESSARSDNNSITIMLNQEDAALWMTSNEVTLRYELNNGNDGLILLIEKDFPCKHTGSDYNDTFHELQPEEHKMFPKIKPSDN